MVHFLATLLAIGLPNAHAGDPSPSPIPEILLKDYKPVSKLVVPEHKIQRARFAVFDVHNHVNDAGGVGEKIAPEKVIQIMNATGVKTIVILTGKWGGELQKVIDESVKPYPGRFLVFTQLDYSKIDAPDFGEQMSLQIEDAVKRGARGLKFLKDFGLEVRDKSGVLIKIDDPRMNPIWEICGRLGIPVALHVGDPDAFFDPIDEHNERYEELQRWSDTHFHDPKYPRKRELLDALERVIQANPGTTFISLHMGNWPENLGYVGELLRKHKNVMVEFGAREAELGRQPNTARKFFIQFQDRIMFGSDFAPDEAMYRNYFRWLETDDDYFEPWGYPAQGRWKIYGMNLPAKVLEKVYHLNAEKLFSKNLAK